MILISPHAPWREPRVVDREGGPQVWRQLRRQLIWVVL